MSARRQDFDPPDVDTLAEWQFSIKACREKLIREHVVTPEPGNAAELRQWNEGPVASSQYDCARHG